MDIFGNKALAKQIADFQVNLSQYINQTDLTKWINTGELPTLNPDCYDYQNAIKTIGAVYEVTDLIAKKVYNSPIVIYKVKDAKKLKESKRLQKTDLLQSHILKAQALEEVEDYALTKLLDEPNPYMNRTGLIWTIALQYLLTGNSYLYGVKSEKGKKPMQLYPFGDMEIITRNNYLDPIAGYKMLFDTQWEKFEKEEVYHFKTANSANPDKTFSYLYGVSPLRAYIEPMRTIKEAEKQASKQMRNGGVFGILSPKDKEDQFGIDQKKALAERLREARNSPDELARIFPSSISLAWQQIGLSSGDLRLIEQKQVSQADIYRAYHMPMQYLSDKSSTFNNQSTAIKQLIYDSAAPICDAISEGLTNFIGTPYGDYIIELDYTQLPEMAVNMKEIADYVLPLWNDDVINQNEIRYALKYGELPNGNRFKSEINDNNNQQNEQLSS